jgi:uncharacterized protein YcbX
MRVTGLFVYPLKSARGLALDAAQLDAFGIAGDRRWCLLGESGKVITQREAPALATLDARATPEGIELRHEGRAAPLRVRLPARGSENRPVDVWRDRTSGNAAGREAEEWLSDFLARPCRLLYMPQATHRQVDLEFGQAGDRVSYADGYPLHLTNEASLEDLNRRLDTPVPMDRFRPNLVIDGADPFAEDGWSRIRVGENEFRVVKPCARCVVTTTDQRTGQREVEPLRELARFRTRGGKVLFGQNLIHEGRGSIRLGDPVEVLGNRSERT